MDIPPHAVTFVPVMPERAMCVLETPERFMSNWGETGKEAGRDASVIRSMAEKDSQL